ncbi:subtilisin-like protein [Schizophyllum commune H4-8]|nr:subtilisin-like protein [Schizophyllum commune H4-8]KAI5892804.1 subtilisin-like protein [Schizophyllum commune H4-8]
MRCTLRAAVVATLVLSVLGTPSSRPHLRPFERRHTVPAGFTNHGAAAPETMLDMRIALAMADKDRLEATLLDVSTPSSPNYGKYLTLEEARALAGPSPDTVRAVGDWLRAEGIHYDVGGAYGDWLTFSIPVSKANQIFAASYQSFVHGHSDSTQVRTMQFSIPETLFEHIDAVYPTTSIVPPPAGGPIGVTEVPSFVDLSAAAVPGDDAVPASCNTTVVPSCLQALYETPATPATVPSNRIGVTGFIGQWAQLDDLHTFLYNFRKDVNPYTNFSVKSVDGGVNPQGKQYAGNEANLDEQYTCGLATNVTNTFYTVGNKNPDGVSGFLDVFQTINNETSPPSVVSTSYGFDEPGLGPTLATRICNGYMPLGARGISLIFASGDGGVAGSRSSNCTQFVPTFPGTCPYITSIGGTHNVPEVAVGFSSGGFSNFFGRASWQNSAVSSYLAQLGGTNAGLFNTTGRAFPDVAAQGEKIVIVNGGQGYYIGGTSASCPIVASNIALINDRLAAKGLPPLGFLNPWLYSNPQMFTDITSGSNPGCGTNGFPALSGWDPVTGLGTPLFSKMLAAAGL